MPITERTLTIWRAKTLRLRAELETVGRTEDGRYRFAIKDVRFLQDCVIKMTQELIDHHLLKKTKS